MLVGDFSNWEEDPRYSLRRLDGGVWEGTFARDDMHHGDLYKMRVSWAGGSGERTTADRYSPVPAGDSHLRCILPRPAV